jgi:hypothetical protein
MPLADDNKNKELLNIIKHIAKGNGYTENITDKLNKKVEQNIVDANTITKTINRQQQKRVAITYTIPYMRTLTNTLKNTNIQITYKSGKKLDSYLTSYKESDKNILNSGINELTCQTCKYSYIRQTSMDLYTIYKGHIRYIRNHHPK